MNKHPQPAELNREWYISIDDGKEAGLLPRRTGLGVDASKRPSLSPIKNLLELNQAANGHLRLELLSSDYEIIGADSSADVEIEPECVLLLRVLGHMVKIQTSGYDRRDVRPVRRLMLSKRQAKPISIVSDDILSLLEVQEEEPRIEPRPPIQAPRVSVEPDTSALRAPDKAHLTPEKPHPRIDVDIARQKSVSNDPDVRPRRIVLLEHPFLLLGSGLLLIVLLLLATVAIVTPEVNPDGPRVSNRPNIYPVPQTKNQEGTRNNAQPLPQTSIESEVLALQNEQGVRSSELLNKFLMSSPNSTARIGHADESHESSLQDFAVRELNQGLSNKQLDSNEPQPMLALGLQAEIENESVVTTETKIAGQVLDVTESIIENRKQAHDIASESPIKPKADEPERSGVDELATGSGELDANPLKVPVEESQPEPSINLSTTTAWEPSVDKALVKSPTPASKAPPGPSDQEKDKLMNRPERKDVVVPFYRMSDLQLIQEIPPRFPRRSPIKDVSVVLELFVREDGFVESVVLTNGPGERNRFVRSATDALKRWQFEPVIENDQAVSFRTNVRITFKR